MRASGWASQLLLICSLPSSAQVHLYPCRHSTQTALPLVGEKQWQRPPTTSPKSRRAGLACCVLHLPKCLPGHLLCVCWIGAVVRLGPIHVPSALHRIEHVDRRGVRDRALPAHSPAASFSGRSSRISTTCSTRPRSIGVADVALLRLQAQVGEMFGTPGPDDQTVHSGRVKDAADGRLGHGLLPPPRPLSQALRSLCGEGFVAQIAGARLPARARWLSAGGFSSKRYLPVRAARPLAG